MVSNKKKNKNEQKREGSIKIWNYTNQEVGGF
jgi:hypothetical protein